MVDGSKDAPVDRFARRQLFAKVWMKFSQKDFKDYLLDSIESKLFGIGLEELYGRI